ncbi:YoaP domain-containing protein [Lachnospiraceae bacterium 45-W7]
MSSNKDIQISSKKEWMMKCFDDGLIFLKSSERGKCFIEYIPSENAWVPRILSSAKKRPFLSDPKYLLYKGFRVADTSDAGINLMYLPFDEKASIPRFTEAARHPHIEEQGYVLYYTNQCQFNGKYVPIVEQTASENNIPFKALRIETKEQAQAAPSPCTSYAMFYNGEFLTNEQFNDKKFLKLIQSK